MNDQKKSRTKGGKTLYKMMAERGYRPIEIARLTDTSPQVINSWMHRGVSARHANRMAEILQCKASDICDSWVETEAADIGKNRYEDVQQLPCMSIAPLIPWGSASTSSTARDKAYGWAVCVLIDELPFGSFALATTFAPGITIQESSGMTAVLFVDPTRNNPKFKSQYGHIVKTSSMNEPAHRKIEETGFDVFLVGMDPRCPVEPQRLNSAQDIIGPVVGVGIAKALPFAFP